MSNNNLSGELPACLVEMELMKIDVSNNAIGGELPANIFENTMFIDLTNTTIAGALDLSTLKKAIDVSLSHTQLEITVSGELPETARAIDVSYSNFEMLVDDLLEKIQGRTELEVFSAKHARLYGQQPTNHQIHSLERELVDFSDNSLLCRPDSMGMFDCTFLEPVAVTTSEEPSLQIQVKSAERLPEISEKMLPMLEVYVKNVSGSTVNDTQVYKVECTVAREDSYRYVFACPTKTDVSYPNETAITYQDKAVSTGSLLVVKEVNELLSDVEEGAYKGYFERYGVQRRERVKYERAAAQKAARQQISAKKAIEPLLKMSVTAYSKCPDYRNFFSEIYRPFAIKYPELEKYVAYEYVSMARDGSANAVGATSMHGQYEAFMDLIYLCYQHYAPETFVEAQACYNANGSDCLKAHVGSADVRSSIELCAVEGFGHKLLRKSEEEVQELQAAWSPSVYFDGALVCLFNDAADAERDCSSSFFKDGDSFAKYLCANTKMSGTPECANI